MSFLLRTRPLARLALRPLLTHPTQPTLQSTITVYDSPYQHHPSHRTFSTSPSRTAEKKEPAVSQGQQNKPKASERKKAEPKILNENPPRKGEESEDVKRHNEEMDNRAEQAHEKVKNEDAYLDKTGKK